MASSSTGHSCVLCDAKLESKAALQDHFRDHANGKIKKPAARPGQPRRPPQPAGGSQDQTQVMPASQPRTEEIEWECDSCPEKFPSVTAAITHKFKLHPESDAKYYCPYCGQQFPLKMSYDLHVKTHKATSNQTKASCLECGAIFYAEKARNFHYKSVHSRSKNIIQPKYCPPPSLKIDVSQSGETRSCYYCHLCGTEYTVKYNLVRHLESHTAELGDTVPSDVVRCTRCTAVFFNQRAYQAHLMRHKDGDLFVANEEQRLMVVDRVDQDLDVSRIPNPLDRYVPGSSGGGQRAKRPAPASASGKESASNSKSVRAS